MNLPCFRTNLDQSSLRFSGAKIWTSIHKLGIAEIAREYSFSKQLKYCLLTGKLWNGAIIIEKYYIYNNHLFLVAVIYVPFKLLPLHPILHTFAYQTRIPHKPAWVSSSLCSHLTKCICVSTLSSYLCLSIYVVSLLYVHGWYFVRKLYTVCRVSVCLVVELVLNTTSIGTQWFCVMVKFS